MNTPGSETPGSMALANVRSEALLEFKKPSSLGGKKRKQKILTEEKYIEEMAKIIQRDFFPDLEKLHAQNDYLDAMDCKDYVKMELIRAKYSGQHRSERSRANTPATFETPSSFTQGTPHLSASNNGREPSDTPKSQVSDAASTTTTASRQSSLSDRHTLDSFLQSHTSEDNYSFQEIIDAADEKVRQKFAVLYGEEKLSVENMRNALALPPIEDQFNEPDPLRKIETWTYKNKNSIMYVPDGVALTEQERVEAANKKQEIQHSATRLHVNPFPNQSLKISAPPTDATSASSHSMPQAALNSKIGVNAQANAGAPLPQVRGFDLVKTPSPRPGEAFSPLMTWGEIEGTPFRLDGSDTPMRTNTGPSFKITENSRRENLGLALAEKVGEKMRAQKQRAMNTARKNMNSPFLRSNMERLASMSPAARRLATAKLGLRTPLLATPSPLARTTKKTPSGGRNSRTTPLAKIAGRGTDAATAGGGGNPTLTDDLLQIPNMRPRAADFF